MRSRIAVAILALVVAVSAVACGATGGGAATGGAAGSITIGDAWVRAAAAGSTSAAYLTITNGTTSDDALIAVFSGAAGEAGLHRTSTGADGLTGMEPLERLEVGAGQTVTLAPGGDHVMLMGLVGDLAPGSVVELTLTFEHAGALKVRAEVRAS